jgi:hypothetical protein
MVFISILQNGTYIILNCHKGGKNGEFFRIVIDSTTKEVIEKPENPDIDVSVAYSHVYMLLKSGEPLPEETVAAWG